MQKGGDINFQNFFTEELLSKDKALYPCFIDFTKAVDLIRHEGLWVSRTFMGIPGKLIHNHSLQIRNKCTSVRHILSSRGVTKVPEKNTMNSKRCKFNPCN